MNKDYDIPPRVVVVVVIFGYQNSSVVCADVAIRRSSFVLRFKYEQVGAINPKMVGQANEEKSPLQTGFEPVAPKAQ